MQRLWAPGLCVCAEGFITLCSRRPTYSPPVLLFPACPTAPMKPHPWLPHKTSIPPNPTATPWLCEERYPPGFPSGAEVLLEQSGAIWGYPAASVSPQDDQIERERASQHLPGGCCALAAIYLMGKFYVANAGDSRYSPHSAALTVCSVAGDTPEAWLVRNTQLHPCLGEGEGGRTGQSHPLPAPCPGVNVPCCDLCAFWVHRQGCRIASQNLGCAPFLPNNILFATQMALDHSLASAAGTRNCIQQSFQKWARSNFRMYFITVTCFRRRTQIYVQTHAVGAWSPRILISICIYRGGLL